jgi:hypothetical protein
LTEENLILSILLPYLVFLGLLDKRCQEEEDNQEDGKHKGDEKIN